MIIEEFKAKCRERKERKTTDLELLKQYIFALRRVIRKKQIEMESAKTLHDSAEYEKCHADYTDAMERRNMYEHRFVTVQETPLFTAEERRQIASDIQDAFQIERYADAVKILWILETYMS